MDHTTLTGSENLTQMSVLLHVVLTLNTLNVTVAAVNRWVWFTTSCGELRNLQETDLQSHDNICQTIREELIKEICKVRNKVMLKTILNW